MVRASKAAEEHCRLVNQRGLNLARVMVRASKAAASHLSYGSTSRAARARGLVEVLTSGFLTMVLIIIYRYSDTWCA